MDKQLFDHSNYGKGELGPGLFEHVSDMTGLERQLFEDCSEHNGYVDTLQPRYNDRVAYWLNPVYLGTILPEYDKHQLAELLDAFETIQPDRKLAAQMIKWCQLAANRPEEAVRWFKQLTTELNFAEFTGNVKESKPVEPVVAKSLGNGQLPFTWEIQAEDLKPGRLLAYHRLNDEGEGRPMLSIKELNRCYWAIHQAKNLQELAPIGKWLYDSDCMTWPDKRKMWTWYKDHKKVLETEAEKNTPQWFWEVMRKSKTLSTEKEVDNAKEKMASWTKMTEITVKQRNAIFGRLENQRKTIRCRLYQQEQEAF